MLTTTIKNIETAKLLLCLSLFVALFYFVGFFIIGDVYQHAVVGAIYELLWLPMLLCLVVTPLFSVLVFIKNKGKARVYAALAVLSTIGSFLILASH